MRREWGGRRAPDLPLLIWQMSLWLLSTSLGWYSSWMCSKWPTFPCWPGFCCFVVIVGLFCCFWYCCMWDFCPVADDWPCCVWIEDFSKNSHPYSDNKALPLEGSIPWSSQNYLKYFFYYFPSAVPSTKALCTNIRQEVKDDCTPRETPRNQETWPRHWLTDCPAAWPPPPPPHSPNQGWGYPYLAPFFMP